MLIFFRRRPNAIWDILLTNPNYCIWPTVFPAPWNIIIFVALGTAMYYLHKYSIFGANCRAIGGNAQLSKNAGIDKYKVYGKGFLIASVYAGFSGIISLSRGAGTAAATGLQSMQPLFGAMIGVFIGMMLTKWVNVVFGIVSGIMTMNIIGYGLLSLGIQPDIKNTITGAFLITLMVVMEIRDKKAQEKTERELFEMQKEAKANKKAQLVNTAAR